MSSREVQLAVPTSSVSNAWTLTGAATNFDCINDYANFGSSDSETTQINDPGIPFPSSPRESLVGITALTDPSVDHEHVISYESRKTGSGTFPYTPQCKLESSGGTVFITFDIDENPAWGTTSTLTLAAADVQAIRAAGAYGSLRFRFIGSNTPTGGTARIRVSAIKLEIPKIRVGPSRMGMRGRIIFTSSVTTLGFARMGIRGVAHVEDVAASGLLKALFGMRGVVRMNLGTAPYGASRMGLRGVMEGTTVVMTIPTPPPDPTYRSSGQIVRGGSLSATLARGGSVTGQIGRGGHA